MSIISARDEEVLEDFQAQVTARLFPVNFGIVAIATAAAGGEPDSTAPPALEPGEVECSTCLSSDTGLRKSNLGMIKNDNKIKITGAITVAERFGVKIEISRIGHATSFGAGLLSANA